MIKETENIELRSEKVRNIIGQIPPKLIRIGITLIFVIFLVILTGTYFFEYAYTIKTTAYIEQANKVTTVIVKVPANELNKIKQGHKVILCFDNIPNLYNKRLITEIHSIPNIIDISKSGGYYLSEIVLTKESQMELGFEIIIHDKIEINAEIITDKISFFNRILEPFKTLVKPD